MGSKRGESNLLEMDSGSSEEVTFTTREKFRSFSECKDKVEDFEKANFVQLYIRRSRSVEAAVKRAPKKQFNEELKYSDIEYSCIHGKRVFKSSSTGERPN